jgi:hypothetical protein
MLRAFLRLGLITITTLILLFSALFFMRWIGGQQGFQAPPHPWFELATWNIVEPPASSACQPQVTNDWVVYVHIRKVEGEWSVECQKSTSLADVLRNSTVRNWLLAVTANETSDLDKFVDIVSRHDQEKVFAIHARSQTVARYLRKKSPQWIYAADTASLLRLHLFNSLWLETAMEFWPDFVIASRKGLETGGDLRPREADEMKRRQKRVIWREAEPGENPLIPVQGRLTTRIP